MPLAPGTRLGPYEIMAPLGAGGMGEVYRARDPRIGRDVAVKVLPKTFSADPERLRRFEQESRSAGILNHPNVLAIYDVGVHQGAPYVVSELLIGETLRDRIKGGPIPSRKAIEIATQIARGLVAAHQHGIIHRDLKPENLFVTKDGRAKILDFGLAKLNAPDREGAGKSDARTLSADTGPGAVWGTVGYMSPEQVRGTTVDHRSDIFAFGAILYEMLSGKRAFQRDTPADTMSAILKEDPPDLVDQVEGIAPGLERLVRHCLEKNVIERFQSAQDLGFALEAISGTSGTHPGATLPATRGRRPLVLAAAGALGVVAAIAATLWILGALNSREAAGVMRAALEAPGSAFGRDRLRGMSVSPDGRCVVFVVPDTSGITQLWLRRLESATAVPVPGTMDAKDPFWSPDSKDIGFFSQGHLQRVPVSGGPAQVICEATNGRGGAWNRQGIILFAPNPEGGLYRVSADGGQPAPVTVLDSTRHETSHRWPCFLPDGRHFLYLALPPQNGEFQTLLGSLDSKERKPILRSSTAPIYADPGALIFSRDEFLVARKFDVHRGVVRDQSRIIAESTPTPGSVGEPVVSVSRNGIVAYLAERMGDTAIGWYSLSGDPLNAVSAPAGRYVGIRISPDGKRAAVVRRMSSANTDLWVIDLERGTSSRLTFDPGHEEIPVWSPDGSRIAFMSDRAGVQDLFVVPAEGGEAELLYHSPAQFKVPQAWSRDGRYILFWQLEGQTSGDIWILSTGDRKAEPLLHTRFAEDWARPSPDGHWLAYTCDESGRYEAYVQSFPRLGRKQQISTAGGGSTLWRSDGKELFWGVWSGGGVTIFGAPVRSDSTTFVAGIPRVMGVWSPAKLRGNTAYDWIPGTQRMLIAKETGEVNPPTPTLVLNWPELLREKK